MSQSNRRCIWWKGAQGRPRGPPVEDLPPDAAPTIYVDGLPMDVNKRELAHIFRPFQGYLVSFIACGALTLH
jgi:hypothetical protein